jgi:hypothetical protein
LLHDIPFQLDCLLDRLNVYGEVAVYKGDVTMNQLLDSVVALLHLLNLQDLLGVL